jgi:hypothetical protein
MGLPMRTAVWLNESKIPPKIHVPGKGYRDKGYGVQANRYVVSPESIHATMASIVRSMSPNRWAQMS